MNLIKVPEHLPEEKKRLIGPLKIDLEKDNSLDNQGQPNIIDFMNKEPHLTSMSERGLGGGQPGTILPNNEPSSRSPKPTDGYRPGEVFDKTTGDPAVGSEISQPTIPTGAPISIPKLLPTENEESFDPLNNAWPVGEQNPDHGCPCQMGKDNSTTYEGSGITLLHQATPDFTPGESSIGIGKLNPDDTDRNITLRSSQAFSDNVESFRIEEAFTEWKEAELPREDSFNESSVVVGEVKYFPEEKSMMIDLNGRSYPYYNIEYRQFDEFKGAPSKGAAYNRMFKGQTQYFTPNTGTNQEALSKAVEFKEALMKSNPDDFHWIDEIGIREMINENRIGRGKYMLLKAAEAAITDHRVEGESYKRIITPEILKKLTYTAIKKGSDINHMLQKRDLYSGAVVDAEYNDKTGFSEFIYYESDPEILQGVEGGFITAVSINGGAARSYKIIDRKGNEKKNPEIQCADGECFRLGEGIVLGEKDNVAFTWVVTKPGWRYNGRMVPHTTPGVKTTEIIVL